jgi:hypothetical protein
MARGEADDVRYNHANLATLLVRQKASTLPCFAIAASTPELRHAPCYNVDSVVPFGNRWRADQPPHDPN